MGQQGRQGACPPVSISATNDAWTCASKWPPPPHVENGLLSFFLFTIYGHFLISYAQHSIQHVQNTAWTTYAFLYRHKTIHRNALTGQSSTDSHPPNPEWQIRFYDVPNPIAS